VARNEWKYVADLETEFDPCLPMVSCLPGEFNQVILNLIVNAAHAIADVANKGGPAMGKIKVQTRNCTEWVEIRIEDSGTGIPQKVQSRIFDPFFTTKEIGKGTGQGLSIARSVIVDKHKGSIHFETEDGKGTTFIIRLPLNGNALTARAVAA
jgi:signal transduction histidine kinase